MPHVSSYPIVEESAKEHDIDDEYLTEGNLTEKELHQLALDEEALKEVLEEEAQAEKERARAEKEWEEEMKKEQAHDELFRLEFESKRRVVLKDISNNPFYGSNIEVVNGVKAQGWSQLWAVNGTDVPTVIVVELSVE
ncbi:hypothetical protein Tco_0201771 [Tanacetum coccineum]